jgi:ribosome-associated heat shock protein Hsp15
MRVDKWLWSVRLYKTRSQASHDCSTGKVKRSGKTLKPSAALKIGDTLEVPSSDNAYKRNIEVIQLIEKRVGAPLAREAYHDHTPSTRFLPRRNTAGWLTRKTAKAVKKATKAVSPNAIDGNGRKAVIDSSRFRRSIRIFP